MRSGLRYFPVVCVAILVLALSPSAPADTTSYRLAIPAGSSPDCLGFSIETTDGTPTGCTPWTGLDLPDIHFLPQYSAAADGSVVFVNDDANHGGEGSIWLVHPDGSAVHLDDNTWDFAPAISYDG